MKCKTLFQISFILLTVLSQCKKDDLNNGNSGGSDPKINYGKNKFITKIDGDDRVYFVHVPKSYTSKIDVPVVFMIHGTSQNGEYMYDNSGWKEMGETENIITVFPSSWEYCIHVDGETHTTTKWNTTPDAEWTFCSGQMPRNDIKFINTILNEISSKYKTDSKRIYLVGFSNGGQMVAKCAIELSDKLAAVVQSAGSFFLDTVYTPKRKLPALYQVGNEDYGPNNTGPAIPMNQFSHLISTPGLEFKKGKMYTIANDHIRNFSLNSKFTLSGDTTKVSIATYKPLSSSANYEFQYVLIKGLKHSYPKGENNTIEGAKVNWAWMKGFSL